MARRISADNRREGAREGVLVVFCWMVVERSGGDPLVANWCCDCSKARQMYGSREARRRALAMEAESSVLFCSSRLSCNDLLLMLLLLMLFLRKEMRRRSR